MPGKRECVAPEKGGRRRSPPRKPLLGLIYPARLMTPQRAEAELLAREAKQHGRHCERSEVQVGRTGRSTSPCLSMSHSVTSHEFPALRAKIPCRFAQGISSQGPRILRLLATLFRL